MRQILLALMVFVSSGAYPSRPDDGTAGLTTGGEYRYDALEYSGEKKHFVRDLAVLDLTGKTSLGFSHMYVQESDQHRWTWNFSSAGLIPCGELFAGHYYLSFGTGLAMGMNDGRETDPFSLKKISGGREFYSPCLSGNPTTAFYGGLAKYSMDSGNVVLSCSPFFSYRERYISLDYRERDPVKYRTLAGHIDKKSVLYEPVYITDAGIYGSAMMKHLFMQVFFIYSSTSDEERRPVAFAPSEGGPDAFINYYALGLFFQYRDDYTRIFAEVDVPFADGKKKTSAGTPAFALGTKFSHDRLDVFFNLTWCGASFFSIHGSPEIVNGTTWQCGFTARPARGFRAGFSCSSEKENRAGRGEPLPRSLRREQVFLGWRYKSKIDLVARAGRIEEDGGEADTKIQAKLGIKIRPSGNFSFTVSGVYQSRGDEHSGCCPLQLDFSVKKYFTAALFYSPYFIDGKNSIYSRVLPVKNAISPGVYVSKDSHVAAVKVGGSYRELKIAGKYQVHFDGGRVMSHQAEVRVVNTF